MEVHIKLALLVGRHIHRHVDGGRIAAHAAGRVLQIHIHRKVNIVYAVLIGIGHIHCKRHCLAILRHDGLCR